MRQGVLHGILISLAGVASAGDFSLTSPIDCSLGEDQPCYIQSYMDRAPGPEVQDFTCAKLSYDGHKGTDFALRSHAQIQDNVPVIASASGRVVGTRDGMPDKVFESSDRAGIDGRDCGNGVVLRHADGWETQYCHFKRGSVQVANGETVARGDVLGFVGMSGVASFPHVHLSVRKDGQKIDPFNATNETTCGAGSEKSLWADQIHYQPGGLISAGFSPDLPDYLDVKSGAAVHDVLSADSSAIVLWGFVFGSRSGDILSLHITGPNGKPVHKKEIRLQKAQAQSFRAVGRKTKSAAWFTTGTYTGTARLIRKGETISDLVVRTEVR